jgi:hypothetical protein
VLIKWKDCSAASSTWEDTDTFRTRFLFFQLEDELTLNGEGNVMVGRTYVRRRRARDVRRALERVVAMQEGAQSAMQEDAQGTSTAGG